MLHIKKLHSVMLNKIVILVFTIIIVACTNDRVSIPTNANGHEEIMIDLRLLRIDLEEELQNEGDITELLDLPEDILNLTFDDYLRAFQKLGNVEVLSSPKLLVENQSTGQIESLLTSELKDEEVFNKIVLDITPTHLGDMLIKYDIMVDVDFHMDVMSGNVNVVKHPQLYAREIIPVTIPLYGSNYLLLMSSDFVY